MSEAQQQQEHHDHDFSEDELNMMLFQWDDEAYPVEEYHYMKDEWKWPEGAIDGVGVGGDDPEHTAKAVIVIQDKPNLRGDAHDNEGRTVVDINKDAPPEERPVALQINTKTAVHIVEFYQPWCGHCRANKPHYISVARETTRRSIGIPVQFHAISCQLYREVCRQYDIDGFPFIYGWGLGMDITEKGVELNPGGHAVSADRISLELGLTLALEQQPVTPKNATTLAARAADAELKALAAMNSSTTKLEYEPVTLNDRYHNAAVSLAFVLNTAVFVKRPSQQNRQLLDDQRAAALNDFLQLIHWATPASWSVRTGLVEQALQRFDEIITTGGPALLSLIVKTNQMVTTTTITEGNLLWGDVERKHDRGDTMGLGVDVPHHHHPHDGSSSTKKGLPLTKKQEKEQRRATNRWTPACTHDDRGMGFTCGLWELLHLLSIGTSQPARRAVAIQSGYPAEPKQVAEIMKRFLQHFFSCDVCRWNFLDLYDRCGLDHCTRLVDVLPELLQVSSSASDYDDNDNGSNNSTMLEQQQQQQQQQQDASRALSLWLWEVHNAINVRLQREAATRQDRIVTTGETLAAVFPTHNQCPTCWLQDDLSEHDPDQVFLYLQRTYWPISKGNSNNNHVNAILKHHLVKRKIVSSTLDRWQSWWFVIGPLAIVVGMILRRMLEKRANTNMRKNE